MTRVGPLPEVVIMRAGYASGAAYRATIAQALALGREVRAIDAEGRETRPTLGDDVEPPPEDW